MIAGTAARRRVVASVFNIANRSNAVIPAFATSLGRVGARKRHSDHFFSVVVVSFFSVVPGPTVVVVSVFFSSFFSAGGLMIVVSRSAGGTLTRVSHAQRTAVAPAKNNRFSFIGC